MPRGKKKSKGGEIKLVRRHRESGEIGPRKRGRPSPEFENGYVDEKGDFKPGDPRRRRRRRGRRGPGRPAATPRAKVHNNGLGEIESIVRREVDSRLKAAKAAAIDAFTRALRV